MTMNRLDEAYRAHADELVRYATALVGPTRANDVVTDAFLSVFDGAGTDQGEAIEHLRAYLFRAVYHRAVDANRSRDRRREREERDGRERRRVATVPAPDVSIDARRALQVLSDQQRAVIFLTYWDDLPPGEVANLLGVSDGTVRKQLARARKKLEEVLR